MDDLIYGGIMASTAAYLSYELIYSNRARFEGKQEVREMDPVEVEKAYEEVEEYFQRIEQRAYELEEKGVPMAETWAQLGAVLSNPREHPRNEGRREQVETEMDRSERLQSIQEGFR